MSSPIIPARPRLPGLLIVMLYGTDQIRFEAMLERVVLLVSAWTLVAPWVLGFVTNDGATWTQSRSGAWPWRPRRLGSR